MHDSYLPLTRQLQNYKLSELMKFDEVFRKSNDESIKWYVKNCDRKEAEMLLLEQYNHKQINGTFLIRNCSQSSLDFSISLVHQSNFYHYRLISSDDCYFKMENSKIFFGLDSLVEYFKTHKELVCCLSTSLHNKCLPIPEITRSKGIISILHKACSHGNNAIVNEILRDHCRGEVDERDPSGSTPMHIACSYGHCDVVESLLCAGASHSKNDANGRTPLHRAVIENNPTTAVLLIEWGADVNAVNRTKSTPLHEAVTNNSFACIKMLLENGAPLMPRNSKGMTPLHLALMYRSTESIDILRSYMISKPQNKGQPWMFPHCKKEHARQILREAGDIDGMFLIRPSETKNCDVLSVIANSEFFNYEIYKDENGYFSITDGPLFDSLDELVRHYMRFQDRLCVKLIKSDYNELNVPQENLVERINNSLKLNKKGLNKNIFRNNSISEIHVAAINDGGIKRRKSEENVMYHLNNDYSMNKSKTFRYVDMFNKLFSDKQHATKSGNENSTLHISNKENKQFSSLPVIKLKQLEFVRIIGEGEFGVVFEGSYVEKEGSNPISVAIKQLKSISTETVVDFKREANIMGALRHHCIVKIYGIVEENGLMMIQEYIHHGSLLDMLRQNSQKISIDHIKKWAMQIAHALSYMESKQFVHRDLSTRNVLVASFNQVKVCDFGLSRSTTDNIYEQHSEGKIPVKWYAIEAIEKNRFTSKSDVWSYGVTLWEMFSYGKEPYPNMSGAEVYKFIKSGKKLKKPVLCPLSTYTIMFSCMNLDENKRPTFKNLVEYFDSDKQYSDLDRIIKST